jgi:nucleoside-diphosphate-sugar epimerase
MCAEQEVTVLGAGGWIGSALVADLQRKKRVVTALGRDDLEAWLEGRQPVRSVIYAIGLTADFRQRPFATVEAHVSLLSRVLQRPGIKRLLFLSSTRLYARSPNTLETVPIPCISSDQSDLYNLSKLLGEALVLQDPRPEFKVVRLSNVIGAGQPINTFIGALQAEALNGNVVTIEQPANTMKNYVALDDVVRLLPLIAEQGQKRLYNLGSDRNTSHAEVAAWLESHGARVCFAHGNTSTIGLSYPKLSIKLLEAEFEAPGNPFRRNFFKYKV